MFAAAGTCPNNYGIVMHRILYHLMSYITKLAPFGTIRLFDHGQGGNIVRYNSGNSAIYSYSAVLMSNIFYFQYTGPRGK